ncbi:MULTISPECIES: hypothetical protein [Amycolatopsis]|uniref:Uncharacterized protein n=1 Tax=Amycolatopsis bullii TaxID=941987 RepID=A0ABQ3JW90_9PSEU|nr:hypothetical protein [Amycolatopsis bullii]GHF92618.1 hypothetical protein GCM10017567_03850 [Amycolatopsis bullii]
MGRHYRDEEPVPHPQDRTPRVPAEGRSEASGAFRTPGRSSISDAFGIARVAGESTGSVFFTEGAQAPGFPPPADGPAARRGEASGAYPVAERSPDARRGETSGAYPAAERSSGARRGETSGSYPAAERTTATRRGEASGAYPAAERPTATRQGETSGSYPTAERATAARRDETSADRSPAATRRGETSGSYPVTGARRGEASGSYPAAGRGESTVTRAPGRGEASGAHPVASTEATTILSTQPGEAPGADSTTRSRRRRGDSPAADRVEAPSSGRPTRASRRAEAADPAAASRSRRKGGPAPAEAAAERTEVITRPDEDVSASRTLDRDDTATRPADRGDTTGPQRAGRGDSTGPHRAARSEGTGSHRIVGKSDATGSHRIVGKKAPRRRIAGWPIACAVLAVLIGLGVVGWNWADNELNSRAEAQANSCDGGTANMRIVVTPSVQKPLTAAAQRWNQAATVVHGQCVHVVIEAKPSAQVLDALVGRAKLDAIGGLPAAWLPESSYWVSELTTKKPEMIGSPAQSVANARSADYPFIGLAGPGIDDTALRAAQTFREYLEQPAQQADFAAAGIKST